MSIFIKNLLKAFCTNKFKDKNRAFARFAIKLIYLFLTSLDFSALLRRNSFGSAIKGR